MSAKYKQKRKFENMKKFANMVKSGMFKAENNIESHQNRFTGE